MGDLLATATETTNADNAYHSGLLVKLPTQCDAFVVGLKEQNVKAIKYKILGSADGLTYWTEKSETIIAKNGSDSFVVSNPWVWLDVQIKCSVNDNQGTVKIDVAGG